MPRAMPRAPRRFVARPTGRGRWAPRGRSRRAAREIAKTPYSVGDSSLARAPQRPLAVTDREPDPSPPRTLLRDRRGAAFAEYVALVGLVGLVAAGAFAALGVPLLRAFFYAQTVLDLPVP